MKFLVAAVLGLTPALALAGQTAERKGGAVIMADYDYAAVMDTCTTSGSGATGSISARVTARSRAPELNLISVAIDLAPSPSGGPPTVSAHAINTKGTGSNNGRMTAPACTADAMTPSRRGGAVAGIVVASCAIAASSDGVTVAFTVPLAEFAPLDTAKTGHVTLMKRGDSMDGAKVVAQCASDKPMRGSYDLVTLKK